MQRFNRLVKPRDYSLDEVFQSYDARDERAFVANFFQNEEINSIISECGLEPLTDIQRVLEHPVRLGKSVTKRADLLVNNGDTEGDLYYFEVMSQSHSGKWDDPHHEQMILKRSLLQTYNPDNNVYTFAVGFREFDPEYLEEIQKMDNVYAIQLKFTEGGWDPEVYGVEEKRKRQRVKNTATEEIGNKWLRIAREKMGFDNRRDETVSGYWLYVGKGHNSSPLGIEWVIGNKRNTMGIKLHIGLAKRDDYTIPHTSVDTIVERLNAAFPDLDFETTRGGVNPNAANTIKFPFDTEDTSVENVELLKRITEEYGRIMGLEGLLK